MKNRGIIYICHHIDTEGPLNESLRSLFERINLIFNLKLDPTLDNLKRLQNGEFVTDDKMREEVLLVVDPHTINFKRNWSEVGEMLSRIMSEEFRNRFLDSFGGGWVYNWHIMDHVGFNFENPRNRDIGFGNIFNFYKEIINDTNSIQDSIHWHFHPISYKRSAHIPATSYENSYHILHQVLCRRLFDWNWFPIVNRAGFHTERIDSNFFLEQWMPFDPSNQSIENEFQPNFQQDIVSGRFGDWRGAPSNWDLYNPSIYDWRKKGNCNRVIARVLNLKSRHRNITPNEIEKAFEKAEKGENVYLGITNHDWREMSIEIEEFIKNFNSVSTKYPRVKYKYSESINAFREVLGYKSRDIEEFKINFNIEIINNKLIVKVINGSLFGPQPYLALKTKSGDYYHDNFDFGSTPNDFTYTFDSYTIELSNIEAIKVASNDIYGNQCIKTIIL